VVFLATFIAAQTTSTEILGTVTDSTGAIVPAARVTLVRVATNERRETVTNPSGGYSFPLIEIGEYSINFLTPMWTGPDPTGTAFTSSTTPASITIRPNLLHDANANAPHTVAQWFDTTAFAVPSGGYFGSSAKGVIKGPHVNVVDVGLFKAIPLKERLVLRWEMTGVNILNHPNYSDPSAAALNIATVGQVGILSAGVSILDPSGARALRMGLRVEF